MSNDGSPRHAHTNSETLGNGLECETLLAQAVGLGIERLAARGVGVCCHVLRLQKGETGRRTASLPSSLERSSETADCSSPDSLTKAPQV